MNILRGLSWGYSYSYGKQDATSAREVPRLQQAGSQEAGQYFESGLATVSKTGGVEETDGRISFRGEQQMLAIGRGLMSLPRLLMLDEPSLGLAPIVVKRVFEVIQNINREGVTILLVEQNVNLTLKIAHKAYILETGRITLQGRGRDLLKNPHIKKAYLGF